MLNLTEKMLSKIRSLNAQGRPKDSDYKDTIGDWHQLGDGEWHHVFYINEDTFVIDGEVFKKEKK